MVNVSGLASLIQPVAAQLHQFPVLQQMADMTIKSIVLLAVFWVVDVLAGKQLNNTSRHLLWLYGLVCLAILPFTPLLLLVWHTLSSEGISQLTPSALFELPVYATRATGGWAVNWGLVILVLYLIPAFALLSRLIVAMRSVSKLRSGAVAVSDSRLHAQLASLKCQLNISRPVALSISPGLGSPISFGLFKPQIMLPVHMREWNESTTTDVLLHELCHIRRLDWLTTLSAYVLACVFWINPLVWLAVSRLREESENSCDTAVLHAGRSDVGYAESLLGVATSCIRARHHGTRKFNRSHRSSHPLVQTMLDQNTLKTRISRVLEENKMNATTLKKQVKKSVALLFGVSALTLGVLSSHQVLYAQPQPDPSSRSADAEMLPLNTVQAKYPTAAAAAGIEGWAHLRFTVSADGTVAESSISIVDAEPADIFNNNAIAAAKQFRFSPRIVAGQPVDVPNVQYVFRFHMSEESERAAQQQ